MSTTFPKNENPPKNIKTKRQKIKNYIKKTRRTSKQTYVQPF
ncbi:hypothetical protein HMPREF1547_03424 [Blautia sp. KLE 1732]|nr:hypothetical protein HMPREF1547_03424 [Blautia sp. KLE 1732]